jgi:sigma-E factor negative regulatory protein RseA
LRDGEAGACDAACGAWRGDATARADWHAYHLIGDLMRSDEHRADAAHDARMLARLREQLRREPAVLAPTPAIALTRFAEKRRARAWLVPSAIAAGFAAVAGALVVTRVADVAPADRGTVVATTPAAATGVRAASVDGPATAAAAADNAAPPTVLRSPELDRYLAAHRQYANGALQVAPGGAVRQAAVAAPGR